LSVIQKLKKHTFQEEAALFDSSSDGSSVNHSANSSPEHTNKSICDNENVDTNYSDVFLRVAIADEADGCIQVG
jgi:hypothetical protein